MAKLVIQTSADNAGCYDCGNAAPARVRYTNHDGRTVEYFSCNEHLNYKIETIKDEILPSE